MDSPYKNIKVAVFLSHYGLLLSGGAIIIIVVAGLWPSFNLYPIIGLIIGVVIRTLFIQTRYVADFQITEGVLHIRYITPFFIQRTYQKPLNKIKDIRLDDPGELHVVTTGKWETFDFASKKMKRDVEVKVNSANIRFHEIQAEEQGFS